MVLVIRLLSITWLHFPSFPLLYAHYAGGEGSVKLLTLAAMVDNLDEWPLNRGHYVVFGYNRDHENCPLYGVVGCLLLRDDCKRGSTVCISS